MKLCLEAVMPNQFLLRGEYQAAQKILCCLFIFASFIPSIFVGYFAVATFISVFDTRGMESDLKLAVFILIFLTAFVSTLCLITVICKSNKHSNNSKFLTIFFEYNYKKTIFLVVFAIVQFLNWTGFCYEEKRFLGEKEIIQRTVSISRNEDLKKEYENNPYCCEVRNSPQFLSFVEIFINNLFGGYVYEIDVYYEKILRNNIKIYPNETHYMKGILVNSCAGNVLDAYGESLSEKTYQSNIDLIKHNSNK
jgi:hypothetical protein